MVLRVVQAPYPRRSAQSQPRGQLVARVRYKLAVRTLRPEVQPRQTIIRIPVPCRLGEVKAVVLTGKLLEEAEPHVGSARARGPEELGAIVHGRSPVNPKIRVEQPGIVDAAMEIQAMTSVDVEQRLETQ